MNEIPSIKHELSASEKVMIVRAHRYFLKEKQEKRAGCQRKVRQRVAECLSISMNTVSKVIADWNKHKDITFSNTSSSNRGKPPLCYTSSLITTLREIIYELNSKVLPITVHILRNKVKERTNNLYSSRTLHRVLRRSGFRFGKGKKRHYSAESANNIAYRDSYLRDKMSNLNRKDHPKLPEIYLDESYCNLNHVAQNVWIDTEHDGGVTYQKGGKGPRLCIIGAGVIFSNRDRLFGEWIPGCFQCWNSIKQKKRKYNPEIHDEEDYHGNFDADLFEKWFEKLCGIAFQKYGSCRIHLDGAKYHKRVINPVPNSSNKKEKLMEWLFTNGISFDERLKKSELVQLVKKNRPSPIYKCNLIAQSYNHYVLYTPPYHPELQPIEIIWANLKNKIAYSPALNMQNLQYKINKYHLEISSKTWIGCWNKAKQYEKYYSTISEEEIFDSDNDCVIDDSESS